MHSIIQNDNKIVIKTDFLKGMTVAPEIYANRELASVLYKEYENTSKCAFNQLANIATLPGVKAVCGLPDIHSGYGFPIGSVSGFDVNSGVICPGGVGYDINCGVRSLATNLDINDLVDCKKLLADDLFKTIPSGMSCQSGYKKKFALSDINCMLDCGLEHLAKLNIIDQEDILFVENNGKMPGFSKLINQKAKARGLNQLASLGSGNHYLEIQYVSKIFNKEKARLMNINKEGQILITVHTGSRALGHVTCQDFIESDQDIMKGYEINGEMGIKYYQAMCSAANYAFCNRALITELSKNVFGDKFTHFESSLIYDVCHNIAKKEHHIIDNEKLELLVHRKGASRAFGPFSADLPEKYANIGQPILAGGSMGTSSYILLGTEKAMQMTLGSSCHGSGRLLSRNISHDTFTAENILEDLQRQGIELRCGSERGIVEEAPGSYKDIDIVADYCQEIGISEKICQVKPVIVIKG